MANDDRPVEELTPTPEDNSYMECEFCHNVVPVSKWWAHDCKNPAVKREDDPK